MSLVTAAGQPPPLPRRVVRQENLPEVVSGRYRELPPEAPQPTVRRGSGAVQYIANVYGSGALAPAVACGFLRLSGPAGALKNRNHLECKR